jgi:uncharacterized protein YjiS (DUF1127 family)
MTIRQKFAQYVSYRRTVRELAGLDSAQLRDLGITRGEIKAVARASSF